MGSSLHVLMSENPQTKRNKKHGGKEIEIKRGKCGDKGI